MLEIHAHTSTTHAISIVLSECQLKQELNCSRDLRVFNEALKCLREFAVDWVDIYRLVL